MNLNSRIAVVGAGPGGLSAAWYLREAGFENTTVLERSGRVGGLARSITVDHRTFDLGANLITLSYRQVKDVAAQVGARTYSEHGYTAMLREGDRVSFRPIREAVLDGASLLRFSSAMARYVIERWRVGGRVAGSDWRGVADHPELAAPFSEWLEERDLSVLSNFFRIPITTFGYGSLEEIPALYALKYMNLATVVPTAIKGAAPFLAPAIPYPARFDHGFQRLFESMAWRLNVRRNIAIHSVERGDDGVVIDLTQQSTVMHSTVERREREAFDALVIAAPFAPEVLDRSAGGLLALGDGERALLEQTVATSYCMSALRIDDLEMPANIAVTVPLTEPGTPWAIVRQWNDSNLHQFYTQLPRATDADAEATVRGAVQALVESIGGRIVDERRAINTFDQWPYFHRPTGAAIADGWFDRFEALQGRQSTWYAGKIGCFELIEPIFAYSRALAARMRAHGG